ncbi:linker for activation of T-cells family member 2 isoform X4 [Delphinapterus leucas]|uniref:Linker for activation of T-cells family member 2 isoform X4 n=1 Tax=Delphinapterus leucas TaxID=9749 RepID=A0A2Y9PCV9_DELLE|nr:linker for activation of T-cells family member 2 isoform X4 [Delphinapterus leucas]
MSRGACKRISRTLQWPGPIPWSGRPGQGPWWTRPPTRHQQDPQETRSLLPSPSSASAPLPCRKDKLLQFSPSLEDSSSSRYQNFSKGSRRRSDASYIHPFVTDYFDCGQFQKPPEDEDDANSYENVLICEPKKTESGDEESEGYQNSASIRQWRESRRVVEPVPREAPPYPVGSPDEDDGEPDYVNGDVAAIKA